MRGLLADVNVQGHSLYLRRLLETLDLWSVLVELNLAFITFSEVGIPRDLDDRSLWNLCQQDGWVLFTENRNAEDGDSLEATIVDSWRAGHLPILTLANKAKFETDVEYAQRVAVDIAELLFGMMFGDYRDQSRIYIPR